MKILVLFRNVAEKRKTMDDHLYSFKRYVEGVEFYYCEFFIKLPSFLKLIKWDGIILHYTLLASRWDKEIWQLPVDNLAAIGELSGFKVAMPQDEYAEVTELQRLFKRCKIDTVFTCLYPIDYDKIYPLDKTGLKYRFTTYTGFVDEATQSIIQKLSAEIETRDIDIGYRARNVPYWLGGHGQIKRLIAIQTLKAPNEHQLKLDISIDPKDVFYGDNWVRFLLRSRCVLGCLGGASLYDPDGTIRKKVDAYLQMNPDATFEETEAKCFQGKDYSLSLFALSPRHFECAMTKTCQILIEGDYQGIFIPGRHYIELKKDFSNLKQVFEKASDAKYCEEIAENAYREIAMSEKYTYKAFANTVVDHIKESSNKPKNGFARVLICRLLLNFHTQMAPLRLFFFRARRKYLLVIKPKMRKYGRRA
jgi:hypothetical protein